MQQDQKYDGLVPTDKKRSSGSYGRQELPRTSEDEVKAAAARIFKQKWDNTRVNPDYITLKKLV
ncbi:DUF4385 family protein [Commensalibacter nepenthis]|uniref:DUF4385 family protein n=1 Tax=Commensalibacter nepenthis TaxID=3043872 RepID=A0ABT6Q6Y1_9PROT|nr:DUF4385 family protein [Commensalibacter sp. TBRC 10068]MDI2112659.1 DUF4385 family protein [Commensalibacter sp. TBRC 10068]